MEISVTQYGREWQVRFLDCVVTFDNIEDANDFVVTLLQKMGKVGY